MSINVATVLNEATVWLCPVFKNYTLEMLSIHEENGEFALTIYPMDDLGAPKLLSPKCKTRIDAFKAAIAYIEGQSWLPEPEIQNLMLIMGVEKE